MSLKKLAYSLFGSIVLVSVATTGLYWYFMTYQPDRSVYPILGLDVSHHQGDIDWQAVAGDDVTFSYIKATEGGDWKDKKFKHNWYEAKKAGIRVGAYHFFTFCRPGLDQAKNFIETVPNDPDSLPPAVDLEFGGNCKTETSPEAIVEEINIFLKTLETHYSKKSIIYVTPEFYEAFANHEFLNNYPLWARSILREPQYAGENWLIWQFHNRGTRAGIEGPVDLNVLRTKTLPFSDIEKP